MDRLLSINQLLLRLRQSSRMSLPSVLSLAIRTMLAIMHARKTQDRFTFTIEWTFRRRARCDLRILEFDEVHGEPGVE